MRKVLVIMIAVLLTTGMLYADGSTGPNDQVIIPEGVSDWQNEQAAIDEISDAVIMEEARQELEADPDFRKFLESQGSKRNALSDGERIVLYYAGTILANVDVWGEGNADYWTRAFTNLRDEGNRHSNALKKFAPYISNSYLKKTVERIGVNLYNNTGGYGYLEYWLEKAESREKELRKAGNKLLLIYNETGGESEKVSKDIVIPDDHTGNPTDPVDPPPTHNDSGDTKHLLRYAGRVLYYVTVTGKGGTEYWLMASMQYHHEANRHADLIEEITNYITDSSLKLSLKLIAEDLKLENDGSGNVDYWLSRATNLGKQLRKIGDDLCIMGGI